jgi:hypothetical protein
MLRYSGGAVVSAVPTKRQSTEVPAACSIEMA